MKSPKLPPRSKKVNEISASLMQNFGTGGKGILKGTELREGDLRGASPPKSYVPSANNPPVPVATEGGISDAATALARVLKTTPTGTKYGSSPPHTAPHLKPPVRSKSAKSSVENHLQSDDRNKAKSMETGLDQPAVTKLSPVRSALKVPEKARSLEDAHQRPKSTNIVFKILQDDDFMSQPMRQRSSPIVSDSDTSENSPVIARRRSRLKSALSASYENALNDPVGSPYIPKANKTFSGSDSPLSSNESTGSPSKPGIHSGKRSVDKEKRAASLPRDARSSVSPPPKALHPPPPKPPVKPGAYPERRRDQSRAASLPRDVRSSASPPARALQSSRRSPPPPPNPLAKPGTRPKPALKPKPPPKPPSLGNLKSNRGFSQPMEKRRSQASQDSSDERRSSSREVTPDVQSLTVGPAAVRILDVPEPSPDEGEATKSVKNVSSPEVVVKNDKGVRTEGLSPPTQSNEAHVQRRGNVDSGFISEAPEDLGLTRGREASIESSGDPGPEDKPVAKETEVWDEARVSTT